MIKVRFAPSPSGYVHIGNIKTAIFNWLFLLSQKQKGEDGLFLLRIDATDLARTKQEYIDAVNILNAIENKGGVFKSEGGNRMNEVNPHKNWAKKIVARAKIFGVADKEAVI